MKTLKFSYNGDTVGVKVPDKADLATALNKAFTALDLEYSESWDVLDTNGDAVELTTKVKLFREGYKFTLKAPPESTDAEDDIKALADAEEAALVIPALPTPVFEPAKAPTVLGVAKVAGATREVGLLAIAPPPVPPPNLEPETPALTIEEIALAKLHAQMGIAPEGEAGKVVAEMPVEVATVPLKPAVLRPGCVWPVHGQLRAGGLPGEVKKVG